MFNLYIMKLSKTKLDKVIRAKQQSKRRYRKRSKGFKTNLTTFRNKKTTEGDDLHNKTMKNIKIRRFKPRKKNKKRQRHRKQKKQKKQSKESSDESESSSLNDDKPIKKSIDLIITILQMFRVKFHPS